MGMEWNEKKNNYIYYPNLQEIYCEESGHLLLKKQNRWLKKLEESEV